MKVTIKDVAERAGVSTATVSYIINNKKRVHPETQKRVLEAIRELNYRPNFSARGLANQKTNLLGIMIPYWNSDGKQGIMFDNPFYSELVRGVEVVTAHNGYHLLLVGLDDQPESVENLFVQRDLDGMIIVGAYPELRYLKQLNFPIVLVDTYLQDAPFCSVRIDDEQGAYLATKYLLEMGHQHIGFITGELLEYGVNHRRLLGYQRAYQEFGLTTRDEYTYQTAISFQGGYEAIMPLLKQAPQLTAVFSVADILSIGVLKRLREENIDVPEDLSIVSFDDIPYAEFLHPALTTVSQSIFKKGKVAAQLIMDQLNGSRIQEKLINIPIQLIERDSVKKIV